MNTARSYLMSAIAGTQTASLSIGGLGPANVANVENYNGTSWTEVGDINTARRAGGGGGTSTLGLVFAGLGTANTGATEEWDGSSWTEVADMATARRTQGSGTQALAFAAGGTPPVTNATEEWTVAASAQTVSFD